MSSTYGLAGSSPLSDLSNTANVLLKDAIKAIWDTEITPPPTTTNMTFLTSWFAGRNDVELVFQTLTTQQPFFMNVIGGSRKGYIDTVTIDVGVRGRTGDTQPALLSATINGLTKILHQKRRTLIQNFEVGNEFDVSKGNSELIDDRQTFYHRVITVPLYYWKVDIS